MIHVRISDRQMLLPVRVTPRGGKDCLLPFQPEDTAIRLKVSAPPEDGKANVAVIRLLADVLDVSKSRIQIERGQQARDKQFSVSLQAGQDAEALLSRLASALQTMPEQCFQTEKCRAG